MPSSGQDGRSEESNLPGYLVQVIDANTFEQILEMDEDEEEREFSRGIVFDFFDQAKDTFRAMDDSVQNRDLHDLSEKGHFLKGSSATLGMNNVRDACEKIQHFGAKKEATGQEPLNDEEACLKGCKDNIDLAKREFAEAERVLKRYYGAEES